jgi:hypothetical protein
MPKKKDNWGDNCFIGFISILGFGILIGGWISGAGFWLPLIGFLIIMGLGGASMGRH